MSPLFASVRAIYFDLDDTLCAYWDACKIGLRLAFADAGPREISVDDWIRYWAEAFREFAPTLKKTDWYAVYLVDAEPTRTEQMRRTLALAGIEDQPMASALSERYAHFRDANLALFPEALEVLESLHPRYPLGLITNGPADVQRQEINTLKVGRFFNPILIEGEMGEGKPNVGVMRRAESEIGFSGAEILFVGNSYGHDIFPAIQYGWRTAWVRRPSDVPPSSGPEPAKPESLPDGAPAPDAEISDLRELLSLL